MASVEALDPRPNDVVLDCCAAPGSKTTQLVERCEGGCVVAVEYDAKRARALVARSLHVCGGDARRGSSCARATPRSCHHRNVLIGSSATSRARATARCARPGCELIVGGAAPTRWRSTTSSSELH